MYIYFLWWRILPKPLIQQLLTSKRYAKTSIYISTEICLLRSKWWAPMHVCRKFSCTLLINQLKDMFMFYQKKKIISFLNSDPVVSASPSEKKLSCETKLTFYKLSYLKISITRSSNLHLKMWPPPASKSFFLWIENLTRKSFFSSSSEYLKKDHETA